MGKFLGKMGKNSSHSHYFLVTHCSVGRIVQITAAYYHLIRQIRRFSPVEIGLAHDS